MSDSICRFMPVKNYNTNIKAINFVYETEFLKMKQPFYNPLYRVHVVCEGNADIASCGLNFSVKRGDVFFTFPEGMYTIHGSENFKYMYISFFGQGVPDLLAQLAVTLTNPVYYGLGQLVDFWSEALERVSTRNMNILTESVLLYTLSYIENPVEENENCAVGQQVFENVIEFVDNNYTNPDLTLAFVADNLSYSEKYLSHLFKKNMNVNFKTYLSKRRIQYACEIICGRNVSVAEASRLCGYADPQYFSKTFKKHMGVTPTEYINKFGFGKY